MSKKFDRVLSDDDVLTLAERSFSFDVEAHHKEIEWFAEKLEQAVLTKLAEQQEPAAWLHEETGDVILSELKDDAAEMPNGYDTPLYKCPDFSCKGKLDSSNW